MREELLEKQWAQILAERKSEILMHESRAERSADAFRDLGRQLRSQRIEINHGDQKI